MSHILLRSVGAFVALALTACAVDRSTQARPPAPPPLVQSTIQTIAPAPRGPAPNESPSLQLARFPALPHELTSSLSLQGALSLSLVYNPDLAPFSIEVRAVEALMLQEDRPPNPELEFLIEDFGGSRARRAFNDSQATLALSQVVELGAKRTKRVRLGRLDESLAAWDYETKCLGVFVATVRDCTCAETLANARIIEQPKHDAPAAADRD